MTQFKGAPIVLSYEQWRNLRRRISNLPKERREEAINEFQRLMRTRQVKVLHRCGIMFCSYWQPKVGGERIVFTVFDD